MLSAEYLAGFFDGEGSVTIGLGYGRVTVSVAQKSRDILDLIATEHGGRVHNKSNVRETGTHHWVLTGRENITRFLSFILPHSIVKADEIKIAIEAAGEMRRENLGCVPLTLVQRTKRLELRTRLLSIRNPRKAIPGASLRDQLRRKDVLEKSQYKCGMCGCDLSGMKPFDVIIPENTPYCRACNPKRYAHEYKPVDRDLLRNLIEEGKTQDEICAIVGINRSSLYCKIKKFGLPSGGTRRHWKRYTQGGSANA